MGLETRFARAASGPIPYRVDGSGARHLLIVSDWAQPYGEPGVAAWEWAQDVWKGMGKGPGKPGEVPFPRVPLPEPGTTAATPVPGPPATFKDGLQQLLQHVATLEGAGRQGHNTGLAAITIPTV